MEQENKNIFAENEELSSENKDEYCKEDNEQLTQSPEGDEQCDVGDNTESKSTLAFLVDFFEILCFSVLAVFVIFSFGFRICQVDGTSMNNTLQNGEKLITTKLFYTPERGDIIVFHENKMWNKPLVKRIIATEGQQIEIDYYEGIVKVDGEIIVEDYIYLSDGKYWIYPNYSYDSGTKIFSATVPEGHVFVMGDNRNDSSDSRVSDIGFIDERQIIGKAVARLDGFTAID